MHTYDVDKLVTYNQFSLFIVGAGGFGGKKGSDYQKVNRLDQSIRLIVDYSYIGAKKESNAGTGITLNFFQLH